MAMQGETVSRVDGIPIQTIVVTNNLLKFADGIVGRYLYTERGLKRPAAMLVARLKRMSSSRDAHGWRTRLAQGAQR
jgi:uncharacterized membrane protein YoaK (UPF0700 family)